MRQELKKETDKEASHPRWLPYLLYLIITGILAIPILNSFSQWGIRDWDLFTALHAAAVKSILEYGQFPFWNPYIGGGNILFAHPEVPVLNPLFGLLLLFGPVAGFKIQVLVVYFLGMIGFYKLSRQLGISFRGSLLPPVMYMLSSYLTLHIAAGHIPFHYFAFFPWVMFFYKKSLDRPIHILSAGGVIAFIVLGSGAAVPLVFTAFFLFLFSLFDMGRQYKLKPPFFVALAVICGLLFSAVKFFPMFDYLLRHPWIPEDNLATSMPLRTLFDAFFTFDQSVFAEHARGGGFVWGWHEYGTFIGPLGAVLVFIGTVTHFRKAWPYLVLMTLGLLLALGTFAGPISPWELLHQLPGFKSMRVPSRFTLLTLIGVAILSGYAMDYLQTMFKYRKGTLTAVILVAVLCTHLYVCLPILAETFRKPPENPVKQEEFKNIEGDPNRMYAALLANRGSIRSAWISAYRPGRVIISQNGVIMDWYSDNDAVVAYDRRFTPNRISYKVRSQTGGSLIISQGYDTGWRTRDGREITSRSELISVRVSPEDKEVEIYYFPDYFILGLVVSIVSILAALVGTVVYLRSR